MTAKNVKSEESRGDGLVQKIEQARTYFEESRVEIKKVTWPTKAEVRVTTLAVLILVFIMAILLGVIDFGLVHAVRSITAIGT